MLLYTYICVAVIVFGILLQIESGNSRNPPYPKWFSVVSCLLFGAVWPMTVILLIAIGVHEAKK